MGSYDDTEPFSIGRPVFSSLPPPVVVNLQMDALIKDLKSGDTGAQIQTFGSILDVLRNLASENSTRSGETCFPNEILWKVQRSVFDDFEREESLLVDALFAKAMGTYVDLKILQDSPSSLTVVRIFDLLIKNQGCDRPDFRESVTLIKCEDSRDLPFRKISSFKTEYSNCWMTLLPLLPPHKLKKFLANLSTRILPNLTNPHLLAEILSEAYKSGGSIGVLALDGLFVLTRDYNLDFPKFYDNLYALLDDKLFSAKYRKKFLKSVNMFMSSTMLPAYVVAGMVKRIARLCLSAPPQAILWAIPFVYNLLWKYPSCRVLIHRETIGIESDPFDMTSTCLAECRAMESSLWEIASLNAHYWPRISKLPSLFQEKFARPPFDVDMIAEELEDSFLVDTAITELDHRWSKRPPTKFEIPSLLF